MILGTLWIVFIILSQLPFIAQDIMDINDMDDSYEYNLTFPTDGKQGHYYVERYDTSSDGRIHVKYTTSTNSLEVECTNIKVLKIYCREMYEDKSEEVFKRDPDLDSNYYKTYFIDRDYFQVYVYTPQMITELAFIDTPTPYNVTVNGQEWWLAGINYTYNNNGIVFTEVPPGHNYVHIYFKSNSISSPVAQFKASKTVIGVGETIIFNASSSYDPDGNIVSYVWDLGEGTFKGKVITQHTYTKEGNYKVILTVTDDDYLIDRAYENITVVQRVMDISKSVDKPIATPGSILTYTISPTMNASWLEGVKDITITDVLPDELDYVDAKPLPILKDKTVTWNLGTAFSISELPIITLHTIIDEFAINNSMISNYAMLEYKGINGQAFPQEVGNSISTKVYTGGFFAPKIKRPVQNIELKEDNPPYTITLTPYEYDYQDSGTNLKWYITGKNESLYIISGEYSDNDMITITPLPDLYGDSLVKLWLVDSDGHTANQPLWINITPVNDKPVFSSAPDLIIHYSDPYTFDYEPYIYDIDTPKEQLEILYQENIDGISSEDNTTGDEHIEVDGFKVTYTYPESFQNKLIFVNLFVHDGTESDGDTIQINVTDDYTPRLIKKLPNVLLSEGETKINVFNLDDYFDDPDRDSLFYSFGETHVTVTINDDHSVDISSLSEWNGLDTITFRARDPIGAIAEDTIFVTVISVNDPPEIAGAPDTFIVHYDADYSFDLTPYVSDKDNDTKDLFLILQDIHIRTDPMNPLRIIMNYPESLLGLEIPVILTVSDGIDIGSQNVKVKVTDNWPPDIIREIPDVSFYEDEIVKNLFNLNDYFTDKDSNKLFFSYGHKNVNITISSDGAVDFSATPDWYGIEVVTFRATDPTFAFVESVIKVTVIPVNDAPVIQSIPSQQGVAKQLFKIDLTQYIKDVDNNLTELTISVKANKLDVVVNGRELVIYSNAPVIENLTIIVSDGLSETSGNIIVEFLEEDSKPTVEIGFLMSILWLLVLVIIIIISLMSYVGYRKYMGDYKVEEVFWIYNGGILISHIKASKKNIKIDKDIVSGMLTGILDFTKDVFETEGKDSKKEGVKEIQMHERNILIEKGKHTFLATVFTGRSGISLYSKSSKALQTIETKYDKVLFKWDGDLNIIKNGKKIIRSIFVSRKK